jgi:hypothetical protein
MERRSQNKSLFFVDQVSGKLFGFQLFQAADFFDCMQAKSQSLQ